MSINTSALQQDIEADLTVELSGEQSFNADILSVKVKNAIKDVILKRNYSATSMTDTEIANDLNNYYSVILNLARYDYNQLGAEGEQTHSENGTSRTYISRKSLLSGVCGFVKVL